MARADAHYAEPKPPEIEGVTLELSAEEARALYGVLGAAVCGGPTSSVYEALSLVLPFNAAEQYGYQKRAEVRHAR